MDFEVHLSLDGETQRIGSARSNRVRGKETVVFEYWSFLPRDSSNGQCPPSMMPSFKPWHCRDLEKHLDLKNDASV
jgi:hypothetical protein